jgi:hypothetical protein
MHTPWIAAGVGMGGSLAGTVPFTPVKLFRPRSRVMPQQFRPQSPISRAYVPHG